MESILPGPLGVLPAALLICASFFTSALTAAAGVGGGLLMLALMAYAIPIAALIPVHGLVQLGSNAGRSYVQRENIDWAIARQFLFGSVFGAVAAIFFVVQLPEAALKLFLSIFILIMVWIKLPAVKNVSPILVACGGAVTTFTSMFAGATGPLVAVFLNNLFGEHRQLVATHGITMTIQHSFKLLVFGVAGFVFMEWVPFVALMAVSGFAGTKAGTFFLNRTPEKALKLLFKITLTLAALDMLRRIVM